MLTIMPEGLLTRHSPDIERWQRCARRDSPNAKRRIAEEPTRLEFPCVLLRIRPRLKAPTLRICAPSLEGGLTKIPLIVRVPAQVLPRQGERIELKRIKIRRDRPPRATIIGWQCTLLAPRVLPEETKNQCRSMSPFTRF